MNVSVDIKGENSGTIGADKLNLSIGMGFIDILSSYYLVLAINIDLSVESLR